MAYQGNRKISTKGTYKGKSNKLGGGGRFKQVVDSLKKKGKSTKSAKAIAATIGRKKYGKKKMSTMASKAKVRKSGKGLIVGG